MEKSRMLRRMRRAAEALMAASLAAVVGLFGIGMWSAQKAEPLPLGESEREVAVETAQSEWTVVIDAGHGGIDGGAVGTVTGVAEAPLNLAVAELTAEKLRAAGVHAVMTRSDEKALGENKAADMRARKQIMNAPGVDAVISIHMNRFTDPTVKGPMAFYMKGAAEGEALAKQVIEAVGEATGTGRRSANPGDYYIVRESEAPAVIVECGFLSNAAEEALLQQAEYREKLAEGIAEGVLRFLASR